MEKRTIARGTRREQTHVAGTQPQRQRTIYGLHKGLIRGLGIEW